MDPGWRRHSNQAPAPRLVGGQILQRRDHGGETASVEIGIVLGQLQGRTFRLGLATTHSRAYPGSSGRGRNGSDAPSRYHRRRCGRGRTLLRQQTSSRPPLPASAAEWPEQPSNQPPQAGRLAQHPRPQHSPARHPLRQDRSAQRAPGYPACRLQRNDDIVTASRSIGHRDTALRRDDLRQARKRC